MRGPCRTLGSLPLLVEVKVGEAIKSKGNDLYNAPVLRCAMRNHDGKAMFNVCFLRSELSNLQGF